MNICSYLFILSLPIFRATFVTFLLLFSFLSFVKIIVCFKQASNLINANIIKKTNRVLVTWKLETYDGVLENKIGKEY